MVGMPGRPQRKSIVCILVIFALLLSLDGDMIRPVWGTESEINEIVFSLDVRDKPLSDVLGTIYQQTGFNFLVTGAARNLPVSISLSKVSLEEGLNRIVKSTGVSNFSIVFDSRKNISIIIIDRSNLPLNAREKPSGGGGIRDARAGQSILTSADNDPVAEPPPPDIFPRHGTQGNRHQRTDSVPPKEVYEMRHNIRQ